MERKNYLIDRNNIYVGKVCYINPKNICFDDDFSFMLNNSLLSTEDINSNYDNKTFMLDKGKKYIFYDNKPLFQRTILFTLDDNNHSDDLLYNSPHYPIFNISLNNDCLYFKISILEAYELGKILEFFDFPKQLTYEDVLRVRNLLFSCDFVLNNCKIFGKEETKAGASGLATLDSKGNIRAFNKDINGMLAACYFNCLFYNRDRFDLETMRITDYFIPGKEERNIISLKK